MEPLHKAVEKMHGQLRVVFKQFPLGFHANARPAAVASFAAHRQSKFWPYHDLLFQNIKRLGRDDLMAWAKVVGLDMAKFEKDIKDPALQALVQKDIAAGVRAGVRGTPSLYLNGRKVNSTPTTTEAVIDLVKSEVLKSK